MVAILVVGAVSLVAGMTVFAVARSRGPHAAGQMSTQVAERVAEMPSAGDLIADERVRPATVTSVGIGVVAALVVVTGVLVGVLALLIRREASLLGSDRAVERWASGSSTPSSDALLGGLTHVGDTLVAIAIGVAVATWVLVRHRTSAAFAFLTLVIAGQALITNLIKEGVARARPELAPRTGFSGESFPSGHSATAISCFLGFALVLAVGRPPRTRALLMAAAVAIGVAVASTRVVLGVHWTSDALAGLAIGTAWYLVVAVAFGGRLLRYGAPVEVAADHAADRRPSVGRVGGGS